MVITSNQNRVSKLVALYGLAGSGKSLKTAEFKSQGYRDFDDCMASPMEGKEGFASCRHLDDIVDALNTSIPCIITDMQMCTTKFRRDVESTLKTRVPSLSIEWHCMDCSTPESVAKCLYNAYYRSREIARDFMKEAWLIDVFSKEFTIEDLRHTYPVGLKERG